MKDLFKMGLIVCLLLIACAKPPPTIETRELKPKFSQSDVTIQSALVEGLGKKCKETKEPIFCDQYRVEKDRLDAFYKE